MRLYRYKQSIWWERQKRKKKLNLDKEVSLSLKALTSNASSETFVRAFLLTQTSEEKKKKIIKNEPPKSSHKNLPL